LTRRPCSGTAKPADRIGGLAAWIRRFPYSAMSRGPG
jgi:hypothetical protein